MTYGQVRDAALQLINSKSIAGTTIPGSYNNQADYLTAIPRLVDDAQICIATTVRRIHAAVPLEMLSYTDAGSAFVAFDLPRGFWRLMEGGLLNTETGERLQNYHLVSDDQLLLPRSVDISNLILEYFRYPMPLGLTPADDAELDNALETQSAVPYYVAAHLVMYDDAYRYQALYNEWETKLSRLGESVRMTPGHVEDVYGFNTIGFDY